MSDLDSSDDIKSISSEAWYSEPQPTPPPVIRMRRELEEHQHNLEDFLQDFYEENYHKVEGYDYFNFHLTHLLFENDVPGVTIVDSEKYDAEFVTECVRQLVEGLQDTIRKVNIDVDVPSALRRHPKILLQRERILRVLDAYQDLLNKRDKEVSILEDHVRHLNEEIDLLMAKVHGTEVSVEEEDFLKDLDSNERVRKSSFKEDAAEKVAMNMLHMSSVLSDLSGMVDSILEESGGKVHDVQGTIEELKSRLKQAMLSNKEEIGDLIRQVRSQNLRIEELETMLDTNRRREDHGNVQEVPPASRGATANQRGCPQHHFTVNTCTMRCSC